MMLSSVVATWTPLVVACLCSQDVYAVNVTTTHKVFTHPKTKEVILPCEYKLENPNQKCNFRWDLGRDVVIVNDSLNQMFYGNRYRDRVNWGDGCSLILQNPCLNDTGRYTFRAFAPYDRKIIASGHTKLIVRESSTRETTTAEAVTNASQSAEPNTVPPEDGNTSPPWVYGLLLPVTIVGVIALVTDVVVLHRLERHGATDIRHRLLLGISISLLIVGVITSVVGICLRQAIYRMDIVSDSSICLGLAIGMIFMCCIIKPKVFFIGAADREHQGKDVNMIHRDLGETLLLGVSSPVSHDRGLPVILNT